MSEWRAVKDDAAPAGEQPWLIIEGDNEIAWAWTRRRADAIIADHDKAQRLEAALRRIAELDMDDIAAAGWQDIARAALEDGPVNADPPPGSAV